MSAETLTRPGILLNRVLEPLGPYIVGTWGVRETLTRPGILLGSGFRAGFTGVTLEAPSLQNLANRGAGV